MTVTSFMQLMEDVVSFDSLDPWPLPQQPTTHYGARCKHFYFVR